MKISCICIVLIVFLNSCVNKEVLLISKNFMRENTGLDTLIRIDGYYYNEDSTWLRAPFIISNNKEFQIYFVRFESHKEIQEILGNKNFISNGNYTLLGDTINVQWIGKYGFRSYVIYSEQYVIVNDTTLRRIWFSSNANNSTRTRDPLRNDIYKFYKYP